MFFNWVSRPEARRRLKTAKLSCDEAGYLNSGPIAVLRTDDLQTNWKPIV